MTHHDEDDLPYTEADAELDRLDEIAALARLRTPSHGDPLAAAEARYQAHKAEVIAHEERGGPVPTLYRDPYETLFHPFGENPLAPLGTGAETERRWLVEGLLPLGAVAILAAPPKAGKTDLATALSYAVATGAPFAGRKTEPGPVLWMNGEEFPAERAHLVAARPVMPNGEPAPVYESAYPVEVDDPEFPRAVGGWVARTGAKLLVLDSLRTLSRASLASPRNARALVYRLGALLQGRDLTVLALHHTVKSAPETSRPSRAHATVSDSPALLSTAGAHLHLSSTPHPEAPAERRVVLTAAGRGLHGGRTLVLRSAAPLDYRPDTGPAARPAARRILSLLAGDECGGEASAADLAPKLATSPNVVRNLLADLAREGLVVPVRKRDRHRLFALTFPPAADPTADPTADPARDTGDTDPN